MSVESKKVKLLDSSLSTRTATILWRNGITYLHELTNYCEETLVQLRNIGPNAVQEIKSFCAEYEVHIYNREALFCDVLGVELTPAEYAKVFKYGITDKQDLFNTDGVLLEREFGANSVLCKKLKKIKLYLYEEKQLIEEWVGEIEKLKPLDMNGNILNNALNADRLKLEAEYKEKIRAAAKKIIVQK